MLKEQFPSYESLVENVTDGYLIEGKIPNTDLLDQAQRAASKGDGTTALMFVLAHQFQGTPDERAKVFRTFANYQRTVAGKVHSQSRESYESSSDTALSTAHIGSLVEVTGRLNLAYVLEEARSSKTA